MRAVNAVTTSWPALRVERPSFAAVAESELDAVHRYLLFLTAPKRWGSGEATRTDFPSILTLASSPVEDLEGQKSAPARGSGRYSCSTPLPVRRTNRMPEASSPRGYPTAPVSTCTISPSRASWFRCQWPQNVAWTP